jgi:hypothetical protein
VDSSIIPGFTSNLDFSEVVVVADYSASPEIKKQTLELWTLKQLICYEGMWEEGCLRIDLYAFQEGLILLEIYQRTVVMKLRGKKKVTEKNEELIVYLEQNGETVNT